MHNLFKRRTFITASLGNTHDGNLRMAKKLIVVSNKAKADAVKFKKIDFESCSDAEKELTKKLDFNKEEFQEIDELCKELGIIWYTSIYDTSSLKWMEENFNLQLYKIPSCRLKDLELIKNIAKTKKFAIMSTGMSSLYEVDRAINEFLGYNRNLVIMHCCSVYPASPGDVNLRIMRTLHKHYGLHTGYDSHDIGSEICCAAVGMGAKAIEKHVTLNRTLEGSQHAISLEPDDFEKLIKKIRNIEKSFGGAHKKLLSREIPYRSVATGESIENLQRLERA